MRGELELSISVFDRGVSHVSSSRLGLSMELFISQSGAVILRVKGEGDSKSQFIGPTASSKSRATRDELTVDEEWTGTATHEHDRETLKLSRIRTNTGNAPVAQTFVCRRTKEHLYGTPDGVLSALLRCTPIDEHTGPPWGDRMPAYARAPLAFAVQGSVLTGAHSDGADYVADPGASARP